MTVYEKLWKAQRIIGKYWKQDQTQEQALILGFARDALDFISATGQRHRFRGYRQDASSSSTTRHPEGLLEQTERFVTGLLESPQPPDETDLIKVIIDALQFIAETGQLEYLADYIKHLDAGAPPYVMAAFGSPKEAEGWLMNHPDPPDFAQIIVAGEYRSVYHGRERNIRKLRNDHAIEYYLAEVQKEDPPAARASFDTREEAEAWLKAQPQPARRTWVSIGGEFYLAAYYPNINHRALFPLAMAEGYHF